eukprot:m.45285 g.45285  ORF g.45285 m.45285 type:complete len:554 (+) comp10662_c0_seq1:302-1963(+)
MEDLVDALAATSSTDNESRVAAEVWLSDIKERNLGELMGALATVLSDTDMKPEVRTQAGLQLKNCVSGQHGHIRDEDRAKWGDVSEEIREQIKQSVLATLGTEPSSPSTAAQVYSTIATIELQFWENALPDVLARLSDDAPEDLIVAVLDTVGYMTGDINDINPDLLQPHSDSVLNTVIGAMTSETTSSRVQSASLKALTNSLEFCKSNFEDDDERAYIINSVGKLSMVEDPTVVSESVKCLTEIVDLYYGYIGDFMDAIHSVVGEAMTSEHNDIALAGVEFWSTVAEKELDVEEEGEEECRKFCENYMGDVLPVVLMLLTKQDEDDDEDEFTISKCASVCLALLAEIVGDPIVDPTIDFVKENMESSEWNMRDGAVMAFGGIISGPSEETIAPILENAAGAIMELIRDESTIVKDTVAWAIGRMAEMYPEIMLGDLRIPMLECLAEALALEPRVATNACWALSNVAEEAYKVAMEQMNEEEDVPQTYILSEDFTTILGMFVAATERDDLDESHLMEASFESLMALIQFSPLDCRGHVNEYATQALKIDSPIQ